MKNIIKKIIRKIVNISGMDIIRLEKAVLSDDPCCQHSKVKFNIIDVEKLGKMSLTIPGMITPEAGKFLYSLCYRQVLEEYDFDKVFYNILGHILIYNSTS